MKQYQKGEFCKAKDCSGIVRNNNDFCKSYCPYTAYDFHNWIIEHGYRIISKDVYTLTIHPDCMDLFEERDEE